MRSLYLFLAVAFVSLALLATPPAAQAQRFRGAGGSRAAVENRGNAFGAAPFTLGSLFSPAALLYQRGYANAQLSGNLNAAILRGNDYANLNARIANPYGYYGNPYGYYGNPYGYYGNPYLGYGNPYLGYGNPYMMYATPYPASYNSYSMDATAYPAGYGYSQVPYSGYNVAANGAAAPNPNPNVATSSANANPATRAVAKPTNRSVDIGVFDDYFEPTTYSIRAGTTVRWTNRGKETHTVTSDVGLWDSGELAPGSVNSYTFLVPGTYTYYDALFPRNMRGVIVVQ